VSEDVAQHPTWTLASLHDIAQSIGGGTPSKANEAYWQEGAIPWVSPKDMKQFVVVGTEDRLTDEALKLLSLVPKQSVLVVVRSGILSRTLPVALNAMPVTINQDMRAFVPRPGINAKFIAWQLVANERQILARCAKNGTTVASIEGPALSRFPLQVAPTCEQGRIVEKLEELFSDLNAGIAELRAAQKKLSRYRQSLLKAAMDGSLTASWRETQHQQQGEPQETGAQLLERILTERRVRWEAKQLTTFAKQGRTPPKGWKAKYPEPQRPDLTQLPGLPEDWIWASVDQCVVDETAITDGPFGSNLKSSHYRETGPRVIRLQNIGDGAFLDTRAHIDDEHYEQLLKHSVAAGDLVVAMLGEVLPRACIVPPGVAPAIVKADCARLRLNTDLLRPAVMNAALNSPPARERAVSLMKGIGRPRINLGALRSIAIPVSPSLEQIALEDQLAEANASIEEMHSTIIEALKRSQAQRQNILKAAFSGQLVPQDPKDEPASVLLERIRAERTAAGAGVGKRGRKTRGQS
jgi:type I restriction enzyme S subunit